MLMVYLVIAIQLWNIIESVKIQSMYLRITAYRD